MRKVSFRHSHKIVELAAGKVQSSEAAGIHGKRKATADFVFAAQPAANDYVNLNGKTFTFVAANPTGNQVLIAGTLALTLTALGTVIAAAVAAEQTALGTAVISGTVTENGTAIEPFAEYAPGQAPAAAVVLTGAAYSIVGGTTLHVDGGYGSANNNYTIGYSSAEISVTSSGAISHVSSASFLFSGQPSANDLFTINGLNFTAVAGAPAVGSNASGYQFQIGANLAASITNFAAAIAQAQTDEAAAVQSAVSEASPLYVYVSSRIRRAVITTSGTSLTATGVSAVAGFNGANFTPAQFVSISENSASATVSPNTLHGGCDPDVSQFGSMDLDMETKALVTLPGTTVTEFDLPAGEEGQVTTLYLQTLGAGSNAQVNGAFAGPHATLTFTAVGQWQHLKFLGSQWVSLAGTGTIAN